MKKIFFLLFMLIVSLNASVQADEVVSYIYSTDIIAFVNNIPINSYNIGGKTVIIAEDLETDAVDYGFDVSYHEESRSLNINSNGFTRGSADVVKGTVGKISGEIYKTDIKVFFNSFEITGYNLGGKTAICLEELGLVDKTSPNYEYGYSKYMCNSHWKENEREIWLNTYKNSNYSYFNEYPVNKLKFKLTDNVLSVKFHQENEYISALEYDFSEEFSQDTYKIKDIISEENNEKVGTMYVDSRGRVFSEFYALKLHSLTDGMAEILTFSEAEKYAEENYKILDTAEDENVKAYLAQREDTKYLLFAVKNGGFVVVDKYPPNYTSVELSKEAGNITVSVYPFAGSPLTGTTTAQFCYETNYYTFR